MKRIFLGLFASIILLVGLFGYMHISGGASDPARKTISNGDQFEQVEKQLKVLETVLTVEVAEAYVLELIPFVEKYAGKKFKQVPQVNLVKPSSLVPILANEFLRQYHLLFPSRNENAIFEKARGDATIVTQTLLGKYGLEDKVLYLLPANFLNLKNHAGLDKEKTTSLVRQVITHELTHALQDQEIQLDKRYSNIEGFEALDVLKAITEGHATYIQEMVAKELNLLYSTSSETLPEVVAGYNFESEQEWPYIKGKDFIQYLSKQGGSSRVWEVLNAPPIATVMINSPEFYSSFSDAAPDYSGVLLGMDKFFGKGQWVVDHIEGTQRDLWTIIRNLDFVQREKILSQVIRTHSLDVYSKRGNKFGNISIRLLREPKFSERYFSLFEELVHKNNRILKNSQGPKMEELSIGDFTLSGPGKGRKISYILRQSGNKDIKTVCMRIARDDIMLEIVDANIFLSDEKFDEIAESVFQQISLVKEQSSISNNLSL